MGGRRPRTTTAAAVTLAVVSALGCSWPEYEVTEVDASPGGDASLDAAADASDTTVDSTPGEVDSAGGDGADGDACVSPPMCSTCVSVNCGTESSACAGDAQCTKRVECWQKCCGVSTCTTACASTYPSAAGDALQACVASKCLAPCSGT